MCVQRTLHRVRERFHRFIPKRVAVGILWRDFVNLLIFIGLSFHVSVRKHGLRRMSIMNRAA